MEMLKVFAISACAVGLCLALVGCAGSSEKADTNEGDAIESTDAGASEAAQDATQEATEQLGDAEDVAPDPVSNSGDPALIVGRWDVYSIDNGDETILVEDADPEVQEALRQQYIDIHDNGTLSMVDESQGFSQDCNWTFDGKSVVLSFEGTSLYTLTLDGDKLSMGAEGMTMTYQKAS